jgi:hypothetical protein
VESPASVRTTAPAANRVHRQTAFGGQVKQVPKELDAIADVVLRYKPPAQAKATKAREKRRRKRDAKKG